MTTTFCSLPCLGMTQQFQCWQLHGLDKDIWCHESHLTLSKSCSSPNLNAKPKWQSVWWLLMVILLLLHKVSWVCYDYVWLIVHTYHPCSHTFKKKKVISSNEKYEEKIWSLSIQFGWLLFYWISFIYLILCCITACTSTFPSFSFLARFPWLAGQKSFISVLLSINLKTYTGKTSKVTSKHLFTFTN